MKPELCAGGEIPARYKQRESKKTGSVCTLTDQVLLGLSVGYDALPM